MKKAILVLLCLVAALVAAAAVFVATFDLNRYRPLILQQIKSATGKEARIGRLGLAWKDGLAVRAEGLALFDAGDREPDAALDHALVRMKIAPLLHKEIRVTGVWLSGPRLTVEKLPGGAISVAGIRPAASAPGRPAKPSAPAAAAAAAFSIDSVKIENGRVRYIDRSSQPPMDLTVSDFDADVKNVAPGKPVSFSARAAVLGGKQNVAAGGRVTLPQNGGPAVLEPLTIQADLALLDLEQLSRSIPAIRQAGLKRLAGVLEAKIDRLVADPAQAGRAQAGVTLKKGLLELDAAPLPLENVELQASLRNGSLEIRNLSARFAEGTLQIQGTVNDLAGSASSAFRASARDLAVGRLAQAASARAPRLEGHLSLDFEGRAQGLSGPAITQSLGGQGRLSMKDGVLMNSNLLRTIVDKIAQIPGVGREAISRIPPQYLQKIDEPNTVLRPFEMLFAVRQGRVFFDRLNVPTDLFLLAGSGSVGLDRSLDFQTAVVLESGFSRALTIAAPPTQYFAGPDGSIQIQAAIQGTPPAVQVVPNLDAALQRVGQQVVTDLLQKKKPKEILSGLLNGGQQPAESQTAPAPASGGIPVEPGPAAPAEQTATAQPSSEDQLVALLSKALNKKENQ